MELTDLQKEHLYTQGYVHLQGVVPRVLIDRALSAVNHNIGTAGLPPDQLKHYSYRSFCPDLTKTPVITDLFNATPARAMLASALGPGTVNEQGSGQIAIRFPRNTLKKAGQPRAHIDGFNDAAKGVFNHFSALCGVVLSDTSHPDSGCFTVWPGSHHVAEAHFKQHGMTNEFDFVPPLNGIEPMKLQAVPGDIVLTHYQLAHTASANLSPNPRYAVFFRVTKDGHRADDMSYYTDIWQEWDGMRDVIASMTGDKASS